MRKIAKLMLTPLLLLAMLTTTFASSPGIVVNNKKLPINTFNRESRVLVPLRAIFESLNATIDYDDSTKTITGSQDDNLIILKIGEKIASVNGKKITLDVPAQIIMDLTVVPVRFISESLGASVVWADKTVLIESAKAEVKQPESGVDNEFHESSELLLSQTEIDTSELLNQIWIDNLILVMNENMDNIFDGVIVDNESLIIQLKVSSLGQEKIDDIISYISKSSNNFTKEDIIIKNDNYEIIYPS